MKTNQIPDLSGSKTAVLTNGDHRSKHDLQVTRLTEALRELYDLLEAYAPSWYTEREHDKAASALALVEQFDLSQGESNTTDADGNAI